MCERAARRTVCSGISFCMKITRVIPSLTKLRKHADSHFTSRAGETGPSRARARTAAALHTHLGRPDGTAPETTHVHENDAYPYMLQ